MSGNGSRPSGLWNRSWAVYAAAGLLVVVAAGVRGQGFPAFPGAEGPGANATGGRGGDVYHVTNLLDDANGTIPGSLRYGLKTAPPTGRIIVFDVGGVIQLVAGTGTQTWLKSEAPNITIAGQTAPGPGITIIGAGTKFDGNNWILRNLQVRPGRHQLTPDTQTHDGISVYLQNSVVSHVTVSWYDDEGISATDDVTNTTIQYSIIAEGLFYNNRAFGALVSSERNDARISYHHNLFVHNRTRMPRLGSDPARSTGAITNWSNNVIYNWTGNAGLSAQAVQPSRTNFLSNYYVAGPQTTSGNRVFSGAGVLTEIYHLGNVVDMNKNGVFDGVPFNFTGSQFTGTITRAANPFPVESGYVQSAAAALEQVLAYAGAMWWSRDPNDARVIADVRAGTGQFVNHVTDVPNLPAYAQYPYPYDAKGLPAYAPVYRPANFDSDLDGMPGVWELAHGLDPNTPDDKGDFDNDGYTNIEEYLNDLAAFPAPKALAFQALAGGRYAVQNNWDLSWQPSRFDEAQVSGGTVVVDAVGQHARVLKIAGSPGQDAQVSVSDGWIQVAQELQVGPGGTGRVAQTGGHVRVGGAVVLGGSTGSGQYTLEGGSLSAARLTKSGNGGTFTITGGTLHADQIDFDLVNEGGTIAPGTSIGQTRVLGTLTLQSGALEIDLASHTLCDTLIVNDRLTLGGDLTIRVLPGYNPPLNQRWQIITAGQIVGEFLSITEGFVLERDGGSLVLVSIPEPATMLLLLSVAPALGFGRGGARVRGAGRL